MSLRHILLEGRKDDFIRRYRKKFSDDEMKRIFMTSREIATNNKFLGFLGKVVFSPSIDDDLVKAKITLEKFIKFQKNLDEKDINKYMTLKDVEDAIRRHENRIRREVQSVDGAIKVYEDDRFTVVTPLTYEASCYYGSGSKWCTAAKSSDQHFMSYNRDAKLFYFLDKKASTSDRFYKVALLQKYTGKQVYYDAPDNAFTKGWILGTPEFDKIDNIIQKFMNDNYSDEIELFMDKAKAEQEMRRLAQRDARIRQERLLRQMDEIRTEDRWNLDNDEPLDDLGATANAVFRGLTDEWGVDIQEGEDIYNLVPDTDQFLPGEMRGFKWLGEDENESSYGVGRWEDVYEMAKTRLEETINDIGLFESFNEDFLYGHLDVDEVARWFEDYFDDYIRDEWEEVFELDDLPHTKEQEERLEKLNQWIEELYVKTRDTDALPHGSDERGEVYDKIEELEEERDEITDNPEGEPTEEMFQERVNNYIQDVKDHPRMYLQDYGLMENQDLMRSFIDVDSIIEDAIDVDGVGHHVSFYDGSLYETRVQGIEYYVFRID